MSSDANPALGSSLSSRSTSFSSPHNREYPEVSPQKQPSQGGRLLSSPPREGAASVSAVSVALPGRFAPAPTPDERTAQPEAIQTFYQTMQSHFKHLLADQVTPLRLAGHLSVLVVGAVILILSQVKLPEWNLSLDASLANDALGAIQVASPANALQLPNAAATTNTATANDPLTRSAVPFTAVKVEETAREAIEVYSVKAGDTVLGIASTYGIQPETILWANSQIEQNPDRLSIGDQLNILPIDGVLHVVKPGDTLLGLAAKYKIDAEKIIGYPENGLADAAAALTIGHQIVIPGGTKPFITPQVPTGVVVEAPSGATKGSGTFSWPTSGNITQKFWGGHPALDIGSWVGAPAKAADSGYVILAGGGWNGGYGNHVIIDHGNGFTTLYAHLNSIFVRTGESVSRGQQVGTVGTTGNSTGPHLHFEIRYQGAPRNPYTWLP